MLETLPQIRPSFNRSLRIETRPELLGAEAGALVQREMLDRSGLIAWLTEHLHDPRDPDGVRYPIPDLVLTRLLLPGQGWRDQSDADRLRRGGFAGRVGRLTQASTNRAVRSSSVGSSDERSRLHNLDGKTGSLRR